MSSPELSSSELGGLSEGIISAVTATAVQTLPGLWVRGGGQITVWG